MGSCMAPAPWHPFNLSLASTQPKAFRFSFSSMAFCVPFTMMNLQETSTYISASSELLENFVFTVLHREFPVASFSGCFIKMNEHENLFPYMKSFPWSMASLLLGWQKKPKPSARCIVETHHLTAESKYVLWIKILYISTHTSLLLLEQGIANYSHPTNYSQNNQQPIFINKFLLKHSHIHSFTYADRFFYTIELNSCNQDCLAYQLKVFTIWHFAEFRE